MQGRRQPVGSGQRRDRPGSRSFLGGRFDQPTRDHPDEIDIGDLVDGETLAFGERRQVGEELSVHGRQARPAGSFRRDVVASQLRVSTRAPAGWPPCAWMSMPARSEMNC
jgi:hypothetical protein